MVRHPMYMYLEAAIGVVPVMTLDRLVFLNASLFFLWIALPLEEDKLIDIFGQEYEDYRQKVPAFFPLWRWSWPGSSRDILSALIRREVTVAAQSAPNTCDPSCPQPNASAKISTSNIKRRTSPASSQ